MQNPSTRVAWQSVMRPVSLILVDGQRQGQADPLPIPLLPSKALAL